MATFNQLDQSLVQKYLSGGATTQLYRNTKFVQTGVSELQNDDLGKYFQKGQSVSIRRVRLSGDAEDFDPRGGVNAAQSEPNYEIHTLTLDKLWTKGFPTYSSDANVGTYIRDFATSTGSTIGKSLDDDFYLTGFRNWSKLPASGSVRLSNVPALQCVFAENGSGVLGQFSDDHLLAANKVLFQNDVPSNDRYAMLSPSAGMAFRKDITLVSGFAGAMAGQVPGSSIVAGVGDLYVPRRDFMVGESNAVMGQSFVADLGDGDPTDTISAVVADTTLFLDGDQMGDVPIGAVRLTLGVTAALNSGIAVGKIARLGPDAGSAKDYGVILRVDTSNKYVWLVPYSATGDKLTAAQISTTTDKFGIPAIGSVNPAYHREHLVYASRLLQPPSLGSGAVAITSRVPNLPELLMQIFMGSYNVDQFRESIRSSILIGCMPSDHRKAVLMLSA
jgi:hypothetical protein